MGLIDALCDDNVWQEFLLYKKEKSLLPDKVIEKYEKFINNKEYTTVVNSICEGKYNFSIPKKVVISKMGKSKKRIVYLYNEDEVYVLKLINYLLYQYDNLFSSNLYSFRAHNGVKQAIHKLTKTKNLKNMYGYKVDIQNYFNSIPVDKLLMNLKEDIKDEKLYQLIVQILTNPYVDYNGEIIKEEKGIMAGVPISSFFANYYLKELDAYFEKKNIVYLRYADDIIIFDKEKSNIDIFKGYIKDYLNKMGLQINIEKEYFYNPNDTFEFLGFSFNNGIIDISNNTMKKIQGKIKRSAKGLRRWKLKKDATDEVTIKAMNRKFNRKFYGKEENDLSWKYWFFPVINTTNSLSKIDKYMQDWQRYIVTGKHNKKNYEKVPYSFLKECNYKPLVHEFYKEK